MQVKNTYSKTTVDREKLSDPVAKILQEYEKGMRRAPCVLMQCVEFNVDFWKALALVYENRNPSSTLRKRRISDLSGLSSEEAIEDAETSLSSGIQI